MIGTRERCAPSRLATSKPPMSGSITSRTMRCGRNSLTAAMACEPVPADSTAKPWKRRAMLMTSTMFGSGAATRTRCWSVSVAVVTTGVSERFLRETWEHPVRSLHVTVQAMRRTLLAAIVLACAGVSPARAASLQAGVGRSDVTPPTGFPTFGYVPDDAIARGQHTRLYARAIVLQQGARKLALVTTDLGLTPGGLLAEVGARLASRGFGQENIVVSASHTHSGPAGFANFQSDNFVAPTQGQPADFKVAGDPQLYGFLVERVAQAVVRADEDRAPARVGWGAPPLPTAPTNPT